MSQAYTITAVKPEVSQWSNAYGTFNSYTVRIAEHNDPITFNRKTDSPAPKIGEELYGDLVNDSPHGWKFKSQKRPDGFSGSTSPQQSGESVDTQDSIWRSVALNNAAVIFQGAAGEAAKADVIGYADVFYAWLKSPDTRTEPASPTIDASWPTEQPDEQWPTEPPAGTFDDEWKA